MLAARSAEPLALADQDLEAARRGIAAALPVHRALSAPGSRAVPAAACAGLLATSEGSTWLRFLRECREDISKGSPHAFGCRGWRSAVHVVLEQIVQGGTAGTTGQALARLSSASSLPDLAAVNEVTAGEWTDTCRLALKAPVADVVRARLALRAGYAGALDVARDTMACLKKGADFYIDVAAKLWLKTADEAFERCIDSSTATVSASPTAAWIPFVRLTETPMAGAGDDRPKTPAALAECAAWLDDVTECGMLLDLPPSLEQYLRGYRLLAPLVDAVAGRPDDPTQTPLGGLIAALARADHAAAAAVLNAVDAGSALADTIAARLWMATGAAAYANRVARSATPAAAWAKLLTLEALPERSADGSPCDDAGLQLVAWLQDLALAGPDAGRKPASPVMEYLGARAPLVPVAQAIMGPKMPTPTAPLLAELLHSVLHGTEVRRAKMADRLPKTDAGDLGRRILRSFWVPSLEHLPDTPAERLGRLVEAGRAMAGWDPNRQLGEYNKLVRHHGDGDLPVWGEPTNADQLAFRLALGHSVQRMLIKLDLTSLPSWHRLRDLRGVFGALPPAVRSELADADPLLSAQPKPVFIDLNNVVGDFGAFAPELLVDPVVAVSVLWRTFLLRGRWPVITYCDHNLRKNLTKPHLRPLGAALADWTKAKRVQQAGSPRDPGPNGSRWTADFQILDHIQSEAWQDVAWVLTSDFYIKDWPPYFGWLEPSLWTRMHTRLDYDRVSGAWGILTGASNYRWARFDRLFTTLEDS